MTLKGKKKMWTPLHTPDETKTDYVEMDTRRIHFLVSFFFFLKSIAATLYKKTSSLA